MSDQKMSPVEMTSGHQWRHSMTAPPDARWKKPWHDASCDTKASSLVATAAVLFVLREKRQL
jgi:hypothetical protein